MRANVLTGAFFAHQPWSAQRASGIVEAAWINSGWSRTLSFFRKTRPSPSRNHNEAPRFLVVSVRHGEKDIVGSAEMKGKEMEERRQEQASGA